MLTSFLAIAAALGTLSIAIDSKKLKIAAAICAVVGAVLGLIIQIIRSRLEGRQDQSQSNRGLRVPVSRIRTVDPRQIGVDSAAQEVLDGGTLPDYQPRNIDAMLRQAIGAAAIRSGPWLVVVSGRPKVGKSRALFEALRSVVGDLRLLAPVDGNALQSMLPTGQERLDSGEAGVLWLDDLEPFLNQGVTLQTLREWQSAGAGRVVVATYGGKGVELIKGSAISGLTTIAADVLQHAHEISLDVTTVEELNPLRGLLSEAEFELVRESGLAAYLVAGPLLVRKLITHRHSSVADASVEGAAIVQAAIDWALCGRTDPISEETLRRLWAAYLPAAVWPTTELFDDGLSWALEPVAGTIALLHRADGGYSPFDYVVQTRANPPDTAEPRDETWATAIETASATQSFGVGVSASGRGRYVDAHRAFTRAAQSTIDEFMARARINLAVALINLERPRDADAEFQWVADRFRDDDRPPLRTAAAIALLGRGFNTELEALTVGQNEHSPLEYYQEIIDCYGDDAEPSSEMSMTVARARLAKGLALAQSDRPAEAVDEFQEIIDRYWPHPASEASTIVVQAAATQGYELVKLDRTAEALQLYERLMERYDDSSDSELRVHLARARWMFGTVLVNAGRPADALAVVQIAIDRYGGDQDAVVRGQVVQTVAARAFAHAALGQTADAVDDWQWLADRYGDDEDTADTRKRVAIGLLSRARLLIKLDRSAEAADTFRDVLYRYGTDSYLGDEVDAATNELAELNRS